ncbi:MAG TPA: YibE/F family protein [Gaiellaceae bacterium]|nr:YibE/F family protein [Gaiellaceae bacterium]
MRGLRALVGLGLSLLVVIEFIVPAILDGRAPVGVALVGALAVMFVTIPLAHGLGAKGAAAMLGTAVSLVLTALLRDVRDRRRAADRVRVGRDRVPARRGGRSLAPGPPPGRHDHRRARACRTISP